MPTAATLGGSPLQAVAVRSEDMPHLNGTYIEQPASEGGRPLFLRSVDGACLYHSSALDGGAGGWVLAPGAFRDDAAWARAPDPALHPEDIAEHWLCRAKIPTTEADTPSSSPSRRRVPPGWERCHVDVAAADMPPAELPHHVPLSPWPLQPASASGGPARGTPTAAAATPTTARQPAKGLSTASPRLGGPLPASARQRRWNAASAAASPATATSAETRSLHPPPTTAAGGAAGLPTTPPRRGSSTLQPEQLIRVHSEIEALRETLASLENRFLGEQARADELQDQANKASVGTNRLQRHIETLRNHIEHFRSLEQTHQQEWRALLAEIKASDERHTQLETRLETVSALVMEYEGIAARRRSQAAVVPALVLVILVLCGFQLWTLTCAHGFGVPDWACHLGHNHP